MLLALRVEIAHIYIHFVSACCKVQGSGYNFFAQLELQWVIHSHFCLVHADNIACYLFIHRWYDSHKPTINFSAFHLHHWKIVLGFSPHYPTTLLHALGNYGNSSLSIRLVVNICDTQDVAVILTSHYLRYYWLSFKICLQAIIWLLWFSPAM